MARRATAQIGDGGYSPGIITGIIRIVEFCGFAVTGFAVFLLHVEGGLGNSPHYLAGIALGSAFLTLALEFADAYRIAAFRSASGTLPRALTAVVAVFGLMSAAGFFLKIAESYSRIWFAGWFVAVILFLVLNRRFIAFAIRRWARNGMMERRAVIVGGGAAARDLIRALEQQPDNDIRICGLFDDRGPQRSPNLVAGYPKLGTVDDLVSFARQVRLDMLIIALPLTAEARVLEFLRKLWILPIDIRLAAHSGGLRFRARSYSYVGSVAMLDILDRPIADWDSVAKRIFDIVFSLAALLVLWPMMLATAIAVKATSEGPVFFRQKRHGFNNEEIDVLKFRSMYTHLSDPTAKAAVTKGDPRVTRVGRFIRKTSIDELPQLFNVLKGDLSLVGPRPHAVSAQTRDRLYVEVVEGYFARHRVKPGVTGWAQINGWRGEMDSDEKIRQRTAFDLFYIENWSLLFDLKILFLTPIRLLNTENAY
ncbi:MAG: undecaprenyl-phosphate glucose phosphotransferase [Pararhizobium sp.]